MTRRVHLSIDRVKNMDDTEMKEFSDSYVKGRFSRFAIDPSDQSALRQRELPRHERSAPLSETDAVFDAVKKEIHEILYSREILPRHYYALTQMKRAVEAQLDAAPDDDDEGWRRGARTFYDMVKDEIGRAEVVLEQYRETSARHYLDVLLQAVRAHRDAGDDEVEQADDRLYAIADQVREACDDFANAS